MPSITITAIAADWRVSRPYVSRCVNHRNCPKNSLAAAREWRECYASKRASTARQLAEHGEGDPAKDSILIPLATAKDIAFRGYDFILDLVDQLPENTAAQCNPSNPQIALAALEAECTYILCNASDVYAAWSKGGPHISTAANAE